MKSLGCDNRDRLLATKDWPENFIGGPNRWREGSKNEWQELWSQEAVDQLEFLP